MDPKITKPELDSKASTGGVASPVFGAGENIIPTKSADMSNSETDLNQSASSENRSAKFKNPAVRQDIPEAGRGQFESTQE